TERVGPGDEVQVDVGTVLGTHLPQGVECVGGTFTVYLHPIDPELRVLRGRDDRHEVPVLGGGDLVQVFLPRLAGGHEDDFVELEEVCPVTCRSAVAMVDRAEGAPHGADLGRCGATSPRG